ncbi:P-loop NTPase fold protein [Bradyrhizobium sp. th.b2]|uniref:P-loop NTPase fold protein n=1 Tax=Bradyrhizobium sp. th-b2 TaxID=172088 RepID=UPI000687CE44|nr:P-loop NTPase fold protein [Bradyrhizobium sp. th.b2]
MSLQETKDHLIQLLADPDNKVIALSGKWGTGKSHLWREVQAASTDETTKGALYVSLFGLSDIDQLKRKLIESVVPVAESHPGLWDGAKRTMNSGIKVLESFHKGFGALSDLSLLLAPAMLREKMIVIDDIERKHEKLSVDEVMGFIDQYSQQYGSRFVLILNSDQLAQRPVWDTLREKVIDQEIRLLTTPEEAFEIAIKIAPSPYSAQIKKAAGTCGLTNIRVVQRVIRSVNRILGERNLADAILVRVVPSIVLLTAINYKGIDDGPDFQFVLAIGSASDIADLIPNKDKKPTAEDNRRARWRLLLRELNITRCDEFETLVVQFLESGQFDASKVTAIIDHYVAETDKMEAHHKANKLLDRLYWDHRAEEADLVAQAEKLVSVAHLLHAYTVTDLDKALTQLAGGGAIGQKIVQTWIAAFLAGQPEIDHDAPYRRPVHPDIINAISAIKTRTQAKTTVFDACIHIIKHSGWGTLQEVVMKNATVEDFESTIKGLAVDDFAVFVRRMLEIRLQRESYIAHFGSAADHFVEACRNIVNDPHSGRLGSLVKRLFDEVNLGAELTPQANPAGAGIDTSATA